ncbi:MAG: cytochrome c5 family protein [Propionivibrio sp.]|uniref:Cytochrome c5 family protein n=1 Tax=Candidatus Propionivibrio dominans TaxID=2954373 RepID=A0A9D7FAM0_9RHOO|nr:cytochrome c5 family protein [Candidatus Propionivibrio dominans]
MSYRVRLPLLWLPFLLCQAAYAQPSLLQGNKSGEQVYKTVCHACHETGVAHAPKVGDRAAWAPLIEEGQHVLTGHAWVGVRAMPARGGTTEITLAEFARAVAYMARGSGGNWKDPDSKLLLQIVNEADKRLVKAIKEQQAMQRELHNLAKTAR